MVEVIEVVDVMIARNDVCIYIDVVAACCCVLCCVSYLFHCRYVALTFKYCIHCCPSLLSGLYVLELLLELVGLRLLLVGLRLDTTQAAGTHANEHLIE